MPLKKSRTYVHISGARTHGWVNPVLLSRGVVGIGGIPQDKTNTGGLLPGPRYLVQMFYVFKFVNPYQPFEHHTATAERSSRTANRILNKTIGIVWDQKHIITVTYED